MDYWSELICKSEVTYFSTTFLLSNIFILIQFRGIFTSSMIFSRLLMGSIDEAGCEKIKLEKRWPMYTMYIQILKLLTCEEKIQKKQTKTAQFHLNINDMTHLVSQYHIQKSKFLYKKFHLTFCSKKKPHLIWNVWAVLGSPCRLINSFLVYSRAATGYKTLTASFLFIKNAASFRKLSPPPVCPEWSEALYRFPSNHSQMLIGEPLVHLPSQTGWAGSDGNVGHPSQAATEQHFSATVLAFTLTRCRTQQTEALESTTLTHKGSHYSQTNDQEFLEFSG